MTRPHEGPGSAPDTAGPRVGDRARPAACRQLDGGRDEGMVEPVDAPVAPCEARPTPESARIRAAAAAAIPAWRDAERFDAALLYGSAAWGDAGPASDGDVMLLSDRDGVGDDVVRASWAAFARGLAGGWWLPRLACGVILLDDGRLGRLGVDARLPWRDPGARAARAAAAMGPEPPAEGTAGPAAIDGCRQAVVSAAHAALLARGVPPSGHHLLGRLRAAVGPDAARALADGGALPRGREDAASRHDAAMALLRWARGVASEAAGPGSGAAAAQALRFGLSAETVEEAERAGAAWRREVAWGQWGLVSRELVRITVLRNVAPLLGVAAEPGALAAWLDGHEPPLLALWWEALGSKTWEAGDIGAALRARAALAQLAARP